MTKAGGTKKEGSGPGKSVRFSYSTEDQGLIQRTVIQAIEKIGGQRKLKKLYDRREIDRRPGETFFDTAIRLLRLRIDYDETALALCPRDRAVVFIANHPYGVLDGITMAWLATKVRPETKVLANAVLCQIPEARDNLLPVDFSETREAREINVLSRRTAQQWLREGHAVGHLSGWRRLDERKPMKGPVVELPWAPFTAKLIRMARATVVPVFFVGQNSRLFQLASHMSMTLRLSLVFRETARRIGSTLKVRIGRPIPYEELEHLEDRTDFVRELRRHTFALAEPGDIRDAAPDHHLREIRKWSRKEE